MTEVDASMFGPPSALLGGSNLLEKPSIDDTIATKDNTIVNDDILIDDSFLLGGLLSAGVETREKTSSFGEATLLNESFTSTGLLSESTEKTIDQPEERETQNAAASDTVMSQSQDNEFPDVRDLLRPYGLASASIGVGSSASASSTVHVHRPSVRATTFGGKAIFLKRKPKRINGFATVTNAHGQAFGTLLDTPIHRLMDDLSSATASRMVESDLQVVASTSSGAASSSESTLWVDRYRPERFTDLVGDDRVHREVMAWVKEWDWCVFGKKKGKKRARDEENLDEHRRPTEKLLLISGPPGLGKTTLAHVVAKQAGYSVFEVNASDARSAQVVDDRIRPALESGSTVGSSTPTLVIIDEIDGATGGGENSSGFVQRLVDLTMDKPRKKGRKADPKAPRTLLRPIVCICNDLYASSLAKLRPHARIIRFNRPNDVHIVRRLRNICEMEGLKAETRALTMLVGVAQGDLRACLNTLQLIKSRSREVTESIVRKATAGMKEADSSQTVVLNDLFSPMSRKRAKDLGLSEEDEARYVGRLSREVEGSGAMDRVAIGCFEHYTNLRRHDGNFTRYLKANEWLSSYDIMSGEMRSEREYATMQYLPYMLVPFYPLFQERGVQRVERPKADWEHFTKTKTNEEIYKSMARSLRAAGTRHGGSFRHLSSDQILQLEFAPFINRIISPPLRPVNSQVIRPEEKALLSRLVDIMVALDLRFIQERSEEGQLMYRLDPPIDVFVTYDGKRAADIAISRYAVRHLVATEIDAQIINRQVETVDKAKGPQAKRNFFNKRNIGGDADNGNEPALGDGKLMAGDVSRATTTNKRARRDEEPVDKVPTDFFGRPILTSTTPSTKPTSKKVVEKKYRVTYRFKEGNSAAVRKPVKVSTFL